MAKDVLNKSSLTYDQQRIFDSVCGNGCYVAQQNNATIMKFFCFILGMILSISFAYWAIVMYHVNPFHVVFCLSAESFVLSKIM